MTKNISIKKLKPIVRVKSRQMAELHRYTMLHSVMMNNDGSIVAVGGRDKIIAF